MASNTVVYCAVICLSQLTPCQSGIVGSLFDVPLGILNTLVKVTLGCPSPDNDNCPNKDIHYYLYKRDTQAAPYELIPSEPETITNANFTEGVPLKVIIHGYSGHKDFSPNKELRPAYFQKGEYNIITVDWGTLAPRPCYIQAAKSTELVAKCAAEFLDSLFESRSELSLEKTHILGFSLGAHVAGRLGNKLKTGKVARVTGFDPALPLFDDMTANEDEVINSRAGQFVDIYHSNAGYEGKKTACGQVDIYFNNGASQPGCNCESSCDHVRSVQYFTESVNSPTGLWGFPCESWDSYTGGSCNVNTTDKVLELGESISASLTHGKYLAFTNNTSPYLLGPSVYIEDKNLINKVNEDCNIVSYVFKV